MTTLTQRGPTLFVDHDDRAEYRKFLHWLASEAECRLTALDEDEAGWLTNTE